MTDDQTYQRSEPIAAVLGGSVAGLMSAFVLQKQGYTVELYEKRNSYSRNIQWGVRQSFLDYLACYSATAAEEFFKASSAITNGKRSLADRCTFYPDGAYHHEQRHPPRRGVCGQDDQGVDSEFDLNEKLICLIPAKDLEALLARNVEGLLGVTVHRGKSPSIRLQSATNRYELIENGRAKIFDIIVVCEGSGSKTRSKVGITSMPLSKPVKQVSGEVYLKRHGMIVEHLHAIRHKEIIREELLLSLLVSTDRDKPSWIVGDVSSDCRAKLADLPSFERKARKNIIEEEFRRVAARTTLSTEQNILDAGYRGAVRDVELFDLQARISNKAFAGSNLVLAGDAVGVGHWSVGGGMHVAGVCHTNRLEKLADGILSNHSNRQVALEKYSDGVLSDTIEWISMGIKHYYLSVPGKILEAAFDGLIKEKMKNNTMNFPDALRARVVSAYFD